MPANFAWSISRAFTGKTLRCIGNETTKEWEGKPALPFAAQVMQSAQNNLLGPIAGVVEDVDPTLQCMAAGQGGGAIHEILPAGEIVDRLLKEAQAVLTEMRRYR